MLPNLTLPDETLPEFAKSRMTVSSQRKGRLERDLLLLQAGLKEAESSGEAERIPFYVEAIEYCNKQLENPYEQPAQDNEFDFNRLNQQRKIQNIKKPKDDFLEESVDDCYYFFQAKDGENMFLHPLCAQILEKAFPPSAEIGDAENGRQDDAYESKKLLCRLPVELSEMPILEIEHMTADDLKVSESKEFKRLKHLHHLPPGVQFGLVEVDLSAVVSAQILEGYKDVLQKRAKLRKSRDHKER